MGKIAHEGYGDGGAEGNMLPFADIYSTSPAQNGEVAQNQIPAFDLLTKTAHITDTEPDTSSQQRSRTLIAPTHLHNALAFRIPRRRRIGHLPTSSLPHALHRISPRHPPPIRLDLPLHILPHSDHWRCSRHCSGEEPEPCQ